MVLSNCWEITEFQCESFAIYHVDKLYTTELRDWRNPSQAITTKRHLTIQKEHIHQTFVLHSSLFFQQ